MRSGKLGISRGHQLNQPVGPTPRLALVPREAEPKRPRSRKSASPPSPAIQLQHAVAAPAQPVPATPEYRFVHDRLTSLERLAKLRDMGIITLEEFAREKALVFNPPTEELLLEAAPAPVIGPHKPPPPVEPAEPLIRQLFSWRFLPVGVGLGLLLSYASQPRETVRFFGDLFSLIAG